jgi:hypothetical protein
MPDPKIGRRSSLAADARHEESSSLSSGLPQSIHSSTVFRISADSSRFSSEVDSLRRRFIGAGRIPRRLCRSSPVTRRTKTHKDAQTTVTRH